MPGKLLWGDIMDLEAPLEKSESQKKERQKSDRRKSRHHRDPDEKTETKENGPNYSYFKMVLTSWLGLLVVSKTICRSF
uniref:Uncharacterized protein n=1 Tax=Sciurus vulgaris TaxID=55149 RepID=A0A8D2DM73_SCIVU